MKPLTLFEEEPEPTILTFDEVLKSKDGTWLTVPAGHALGRGDAWDACVEIMNRDSSYGVNYRLFLCQNRSGDTAVQRAFTEKEEGVLPPSGILTPQPQTSTPPPSPPSSPPVAVPQKISPAATPSEPKKKGVIRNLFTKKDESETRNAEDKQQTY